MGRKARSRTELTKGTGLSIRGSISRHVQLLLGSTVSHIDHPQTIPQMLDLD